MREVKIKIKRQLRPILHQTHFFSVVSCFDHKQFQHWGVLMLQFGGWSSDMLIIMEFVPSVK